MGRIGSAFGGHVATGLCLRLLNKPRVRVIPLSSVARMPLHRSEKPGINTNFNSVQSTQFYFKSYINFIMAVLTFETWA